MSIAYMTRVWSMRIESGIVAKMVLLKLADNADDDGRCYPSVRHLATACQMTENGIRNQIKKLEGEGLVGVEIGGGRKANTYTLFPTKPPLHGVDPCTALTTDQPLMRLTPPPNAVDPTPQRPIGGSPQRPIDPNHNTTTIEPSWNQQTASPSSTEAAASQSHEAVALWIQAYNDAYPDTPYRNTLAKRRRADEQAAVSLLKSGMTAEQVGDLAKRMFATVKQAVNGKAAWWATRCRTVENFAMHVNEIEGELNGLAQNQRSGGARASRTAGTANDTPDNPYAGL